MDFYDIVEREGVKKGTLDVYPDFRVLRSNDLMIRGKSFYAVWDEEEKLWSTDEYAVQRLVDEELRAYKPKGEGTVHKKYLGNFSNNTWMQFMKYTKNLSDSYHQIDNKIVFANTHVTKRDYVSKRLPYAMEEGSIEAWDELVSTLYDDEERAKIEWAIGAIISGDSRKIQKFLVFYGKGGDGKSTIIGLFQRLFEGYYVLFEAKSLVGSNNNFAVEMFKDNPLVAIQHDGDLSKIEDNSKLNSIVSHEEMVINEKFKAAYSQATNAFLIMGTNKPVKITDAKSGLIRRLIDVTPTGNRIPHHRYQMLMSQIEFELGAIAHHCLEVYRSMGKDFYADYKPLKMMRSTDVFFNFVLDHFDVFKSQDGVSLRQAYALYKTYCEETSLEYKIPMYKFHDELANYFREFHERYKVDGSEVRSYFKGFKTEVFTSIKKPDEPMLSLVLDQTESIFDFEFADAPAQLTKEDGSPQHAWSRVKTTLQDIDTHEVHYVKVPEKHIVIDFDLRNEQGEKDAQKNLEAASEWPPTYAEYSKSGGGIHLHYNYSGDVTELSRVYSDGIEVKVFTGNSSLRRKLSGCNDLPIATLNGGLPLKEKKTVIDKDRLMTEKGMRELIQRNLRKEIHPGTKPSMDFIAKVFEDAHKQGLEFDLTDMRPAIMAFAASSTNQAEACMKILMGIKFKSENQSEVTWVNPEGNGKVIMPKDRRVVFYDVEVFPNLFVVCWKFEGAKTVTRMINPSQAAIEELVTLKLVGFNNRRYDNHILYGAMMGFDNAQLYKLSKKIIDGSPNALFGEAYNLSYTDIYDFANVKQGLKKWMIELGMHHVENEFPWDEPVPEDKWEEVADYCENDVRGTEGVWNARKADFTARQILAELSGLSVNSTTQQHAARFIFEGERKPQKDFVYTDLSELFPGYTYEFGKSYYKGELVGEGGYVYSEPGIYEDVALLDVASMHPTSIEQLDLFGPYTRNFSDIKRARIAIKRGEIDVAKAMLGGKLAPYLGSDENAEALSYALKIVINIVYGLTAAGFDNAFRDPRNKDNIVAKRGALFMIDLKEFVQSQGYTVAHIKTDSIKIPNADKKIIDLVMEFGEKYGYEFEHEATYTKMALVNDAVYVAKTLPGRKPSYWTATGAQFQHPYVFKTLFSHEELTFEDYCETKQVTTALYLDFEDPDKAMALRDESRKRFVGRIGRFIPVKPDCGGGTLVRDKDGKYYAATGTKGYLWAEAEVIRQSGKKVEDVVDMSYFRALVDDALATIGKFGDAEAFIDD